MLRKLLAGTGLLLGVAGFIIFIAISVGVWYAKRDADRELTRGVEKAHKTADVAAQVIALIREIIARANASLATARAESASVTAAGDQDPLVRMAMWKAKRDLPGEVERARDAVGIASEAVIVAGAAFEVFGEQKADEKVLGVKPKEMQAARTQLDAAATELKNARTVLGVPIPGAATSEQLTQVDQALKVASQVTEQSDQAVKNAREEVDSLQNRANRWSLWAAIAVTALGALAALGQIFLVRASWCGLRSAQKDGRAG